MENYHACAILATSDTTSKKKRKIAKKHSERMAKKFKASRETLETFAEEPKATSVTSHSRTTHGNSIPFEAHSLYVDNTSSIPSTTLT